MTILKEEKVIDNEKLKKNSVFGLEWMVLYKNNNLEINAHF